MNAQLGPVPLYKMWTGPLCAELIQNPVQQGALGEVLASVLDAYVPAFMVACAEVIPMQQATEIGEVLNGQRVSEDPLAQSLANVLFLCKGDMDKVAWARLQARVLVLDSRLHTACLDAGLSIEEGRALARTVLGGEQFLEVAA